MMNERRLVLDTNAFRGLRRKEVEELAGRGFTFVVSEIALSEAMAASVREFEAGRPRDRARGLFFKRAKLFARYVDPEYPVAVAGGHAIERIRNATTGVFDADSENAKHAEHLRQVWHVLVGIELLDEEWISAGHEAERWLAHLDAELQSLARREAELWNGVPDEIAEKRAGWLALSEEERLGHLREYLLSTWAFDEAMTDRLDGHTRFFAWRLHQAALGREMTKENDAADLRFIVHLGEGFLLLSGDASFVRLVDESGTHQAPWVRRLQDLDDPLPDGPPWGGSAHEAARAFRRGS